MRILRVSKTTTFVAIPVALTCFVLVVLWSVIGRNSQGTKPTMLWTAVADEDISRVTYLLEQGANPNEASLGWYPLHEAVIRANKLIVVKLIDYGADVNLQSNAPRHAGKKSNKWTAVHYASSFGHEEVLQILIDNDARIDIEDRWGKTALNYAKKEGHNNNIIKLLSFPSKPSSDQGKE